MEPWLESSSEISCPCCRKNFYYSELPLHQRGNMKRMLLPSDESRKNGRFCVKHGLMLPLPEDGDALKFSSSHDHKKTE